MLIFIENLHLTVTSQQGTKHRQEHGWLSGTPVEHGSFADELSLSCARPTVDG